MTAEHHKDLAVARLVDQAVPDVVSRAVAAVNVLVIVRRQDRGDALVGVDHALRPGQIAGVGLKLNGDVQEPVPAGVEEAVRVHRRKSFHRRVGGSIRRRISAIPTLARVTRAIVEILDPLGRVLFLIPMVIVVIAGNRVIGNVGVIEHPPRVACPFKLRFEIVVDRIDRIDARRPRDCGRAALRDDVTGVGRRDLMGDRIGRVGISILHFITESEDEADVLRRRIADDPVHLAGEVLVGFPLNDCVVLRIGDGDEGELAGTLIECERGRFNQRCYNRRADNNRSP